MRKSGWVKLVKWIVVGFLIGLVVGLVSGILQEKGLGDIKAEDIDSMIQGIVPYLFIVATIFCGVGLSGSFYFDNLLKKDGYSNEENSLYEKNEKKMNIAMGLSATGIIINMTSFVVSSGEVLDSNGEFLVVVLTIMIFLFNAMIYVVNQIYNTALIKKIRPEIDPDPLSEKFHQEYFDRLDEREQFQVGRSCFRTVSSMTVGHLIVVLACCPIIVVFDVTPLICLPVALAWVLETVMNVYYTNKEL